MVIRVMVPSSSSDFCGGHYISVRFYLIFTFHAFRVHGLPRHLGQECGIYTIGIRGIAAASLAREIYKARTPGKKRQILDGWRAIKRR